MKEQSKVKVNDNDLSMAAVWDLIRIQLEESELQLQKLLLAANDTTNQVCGMTNGPRPSASTRIIGGSRVISQNEFPWQVYLIITTKRSGFSVCGGSLIDSRWVLTAAHCLDGGVINVTLYFGSPIVTSIKEPNQLVFNSNKTFIHPLWQLGSMRGDIALVQLPKDVPFTRNIRPVCLPKSTDSNHVGDSVTLTGWGSISDTNRDIVSTLRKADSEVISNSQCQQWHLTVEISNQYHICILGSSTVCSGDSGGPMNLKNADGSWTAIGVVSFGSSKGCKPGIPAVFTRIQSHLDWINAIKNGTNWIITTMTLAPLVEIRTTAETLSITTDAASFNNGNVKSILTNVLFVCVFIAPFFFTCW